jgi:hypothetical protein
LRLWGAEALPSCCGVFFDRKAKNSFVPYI